MIRISLPGGERERLDHHFRTTPDRQLRDRLQVVRLAQRGRPPGYVPFLLPSPSPFTCAQAAPVQPLPTAHDAFNRPLTPWQPDPQALGREAPPQLRAGERLKRQGGVQRCQACRAKARRNPMGLSIRAFARLGGHCFALGRSWFQAKTDVIRQAVKTYLAKPNRLLPKAA